MYKKHHYHKPVIQSAPSSEVGFTLVEVMIASMILLFTMASIGRFTQAAMVSGANQGIRSKVEAIIMNNIQKIQQQDSRLTWEAVISSNEQEFACNNPVEYTRSKLEDEMSSYYVAIPNNIERIITDSSAVPESTPGVMIITYSFEAPEYSIGTEKRFIELNPTFAADCLDLDVTPSL